MFKLEWFNYRLEVCEVNSSLQCNCYYLVKNNLGRNFYSQILLNSKFLIANYTFKSGQVFSEVNSSTYLTLQHIVKNNLSHKFIDCKFLVAYVQEVSEVSFLVYNTTPKNNLRCNLYNQMLLNCKFFIATHKSRPSTKIQLGINLYFEFFHRKGKTPFWKWPKNHVLYIQTWPSDVKKLKTDYHTCFWNY